jgi:hypothetical protein
MMQKSAISYYVPKVALLREMSNNMASNYSETPPATSMHQSRALLVDTNLIKLRVQCTHHLDNQSFMVIRIFVLAFWCDQEAPLELNLLS